jgi:SAM-dependent methyltransferase
MPGFDTIYETNEWGFGSGPGSLPSTTRLYRAFLEDFLVKHNIGSVLDYGCGDWQFSRLVDWHGAHYTGVDVVKTVIDRNIRKYASPRAVFRAIGPADFGTPAADLLIAKDVLQHLTGSQIESFVKNILPRHKFALVTNCVNPAERINCDIATGGFRPLDLRKHPFNLPAESVLEFSVPAKFSWRRMRKYHASMKMTLLVRN